MKKVTVQYSFEDSVARVLLSDGKGNVLDQTMMDELMSLFDEFKNKPGLKLILFEGDGKHFSFGASVEEHKKENAAAMLKVFHQLFYTLSELSIPTAALVSGQCLGGGMELVLMCNFIFADKTAKFAQPEIILGVFPPPASVILPEKIGLARAEELLLTGKSISAEQAYAAGLVNEVFEDKSALVEGVDKWISATITTKSASSLRYGVRAVRLKFNQTLRLYLSQLEAMYVNELMETPDANEGIQAFLEKRSPVWKYSKVVQNENN